jgi:Gpi18-like mannosyltransferase
MSEGGSLFDKEERQHLGSFLSANLRRHGREILMLVVGLVITIQIRVMVFGFHSGDLDSCILKWCDKFRRLGFAGALASGDIDYNPTYLYFLWLVAKLQLDRVFFIKLLPVIFDYLCAATLGFIVYRETRSRLRAVAAAFALLITPTVVFNGALWGQCDMIYAAPMMIALAAALRQRYRLAIGLFGFALAVKLQALFLFPMLGLWTLRREFPWRWLLILPLVYLLCLEPAWILGCSIVQLLTIYPRQTGHNTALTMNSPSIFNWMPEEVRWLGFFGLWFAAAVVFLVFVACLYSKRRVSTIVTVQQALIFACLCPFLLPHMHERYVFLGDILGILYAFLRPKHLWCSILIIGSSFICYFSFLFSKIPVPLTIASVMLGIVCVFLVLDLLRTLYPTAFATEETAPRSIG